VTIGAIALFMMFSLALAPMAYASTSIPTTGTFVFRSTPQKAILTHDGTELVFFTFIQNITGAYSGTRVGTGTLAIHPDGTIKNIDTGTFTGTIAGKEGTATITARCSGTLASFTCTFVATDGHGRLEGVHGKGRSAGHAISPTTSVGTYSGQVHFCEGVDK